MGKYIPTYLILFVAIVKGIVSLTSLSAAAATAKSLQSCLTLCDPIGGTPPGSPIPGILQAVTLEWVAIAFSQSCLTDWNSSVLISLQLWALVTC